MAEATPPPQCDPASAHAFRCPQVLSSAPTAPATRNCSVARARTSPAPQSASGSRRCCPRGEGVGPGIGRGRTAGTERDFSEVEGRRYLCTQGRGKERRLTPILPLLEPTSPLERAPALTTPSRGGPCPYLAGSSGLTLPLLRLPGQILNPRVPPHPHPVLGTPRWADPAPHSVCLPEPTPGTYFHLAPDEITLPREVPTHGTAPGTAPPPAPSCPAPKRSAAQPRPSQPSRPCSSVGEVQWEAEFFALQDSNNKLAGALRDANAAAAQWRQQLEAQRAEAERLRQRVRGPLPPRDAQWPPATVEPLPPSWVH